MTLLQALTAERPLRSERRVKLVVECMVKDLYKCMIVRYEKMLWFISMENRS